MSSDNKGGRVEVRQAAPIPRMQETLSERGAPIPNLQPVPQSQQPTGPAAITKHSWSASIWHDPIWRLEEVIPLWQLADPERLAQDNDNKESVTWP